MDPARIGPYELIDEIGRGGMGVVYRARHGDSGEEVALKVARSQGTVHASLRTEIRALRGLRHPGVVRIVDHGIASGEPWYAMELLAGRSWYEFNQAVWQGAGAGPVASTLDLGELRAPAEPVDLSAPPPPTGRKLAGNGRLPEILELARRVCEPLALLHGRGIVHRDLKPANIFLRDDGTPVLMDLGLAGRFTSRQGRERLEVMGLLNGTPQYMAPEQVRGLPVDARADLYALGSILYESITGRIPFSAPTVPSLLAAVVNDPPPKPSTVVDGVPPEIERLVLGLLEKDPRDRIGYADDVAAILGGTVGSGEAPRAYLYRPGVAGREAEVTPVTTLLDGAQAGKGALVLVGGESGVGKTALAGEAGRLASRRRIAVVTGECVPAMPGDATMADNVGAPLQPLRPLLQFIADACRAEGAAAADRVLGPHTQVLAPYEPALTSIPSLRRWPAPLPLHGELARRRVLASLTTVLAEYADAFGAFLLILDDLQWADDLTLAFLAELTPEWLARHGVVVIATYRTDEVTPPLRALLDGPVTLRIDLGRLSEAPVQAMVGDMLALRAPPLPFVGFLYRQSEGNPFFVAEYLRVAVQEGLLRRAGGRWLLPEGADFSGLPQPGSLRALVERRLSGLSAAARRALETAAVLGREVETALLFVVLGVQEEEGHEALRELFDRQVLEATVEGTVRFQHDKLREHALGGIEAEHAVGLHHRAAEALERRAEATPPALLAHHWREARVWDRAVHHLERAVEQELDQYSNAEARRHVDELFTLGERLDGGPGRLRAGRWERFRADASLGQGAYADGRAHAEAALTRLDTPFPKTRPALVASLLRQVALMNLRRLLPRAGVPGSPEDRRVRQESLGVFAVLMDYFIYENDPIRGIYSGIRVIAMGSPMGPSRPLARALGLMGTILLATPFKGVGATWRARALAMAEGVGDPTTQSYVLVRVASTYVFVADFAECDRLCGRALEIATASRDDRRQEECHVTTAFERYMQGRFGEALTEAEWVEGSAMGRKDRQTASWARSGRAQSLIRLGRLQEADQVLKTDLDWVDASGTRTEQVLTYGIIALLHAERGDLAQARTAATRALDWLRREPIVLWFFAPATYALAEVWLTLAAASKKSGSPDAKADAASARAAVELVRTFSKTFPVALAPAALCEARLALLAGKAPAAESAAARAAERAEKDGLPFEEAHARLLLADLGRDRLAQLQKARALFAACGATRDAARIDAA